MVMYMAKHDVQLDLMIMSGPDDGLIHKLTGDFVHDEHLDQWGCRFTMGRRDACHVCIPFDTLVSRLHASLEITPDGHIWLVDEKSRNGTFFGREKVTVPYEIEQDDLFKVGKTLVRVQQLLIVEGAQ